MTTRLAVYFLLMIPAFGADRNGELGNLWGELQPGPHGVGFRFDRGIDARREINRVDRGTPIGIAIWYPAAKAAMGQPGIHDWEYRMMAFGRPFTEAERRAHLDSEAAQAVGWRHVGIVPLTFEQARLSQEARGHAVRGAPPAAGKFPVVVVMGGPWYLSTTAEFLASNGFVVVAPSRFYRDQIDEVPPTKGRDFMQRDMEDAEWAIQECKRLPQADTAHVSVIGHGGGGMQALLLAMRNRGIQALANIDAGNFSARSSLPEVPFAPRNLRIPYLFMISSGSRNDLDQFDEFEKLKFSKRYEVVIEDPELRHHDLSNVGRPISAALGIRGPMQSAILSHYAGVQQTLLRFLKAYGAAESHDAAFATWIQERNGTRGLRVTIRNAAEAAPATGEVTRSLTRLTPERLRQIHAADPEAPLFRENDLTALIGSAIVQKQLPLGVSIGAFAAELHPKSIAVLNAYSRALEAGGDRSAARQSAEACAAVSTPQNVNWQIGMRKTECEERVKRLAK